MAEHPPPVSGIAQEAWHQTPTAVREFVYQQQARLARLEKRLAHLEARLTQNSTNSSKPPSSDNPYQKPKPGAQPGAAPTGQKPAKGKAGGKKGQAGCGPRLLPPAEKHIQPSRCRCGSMAFTDLGVYHTHQQIELPEIKLAITHFLLHASRCQACGQTCKGKLSSEAGVGYGPRLSALIAEMVGMYGNSRTTVQTFCASVLKVPISLARV
jgi:transposase